MTVYELANLMENVPYAFVKNNDVKFVDVNGDTLNGIDFDTAGNFYADFEALDNEETLEFAEVREFTLDFTMYHQPKITVVLDVYNGDIVDAMYPRGI